MKKLAMIALAVSAICGCSNKDSNTVKMITEATFPPYEFLRGQEIVGIDVEICRAVARRLGKELRVETMDFDSVIPAVISGKADLAASGITITIGNERPSLITASIMRFALPEVGHEVWVPFAPCSR